MQYIVRQAKVKATKTITMSTEQISGLLLEMADADDMQPIVDAIKHHCSDDGDIWSFFTHYFRDMIAKEEDKGGLRFIWVAPQNKEILSKIDDDELLDSDEFRSELTALIEKYDVPRGS